MSEIFAAKAIQCPQRSADTMLCCASHTQVFKLCKAAALQLVSLQSRREALALQAKALMMHSIPTQSAFLEGRAAQAKVQEQTERADSLEAKAAHKSQSALLAFSRDCWELCRVVHSASLRKLQEEEALCYSSPSKHQQQREAVAKATSSARSLAKAADSQASRLRKELTDAAFRMVQID